MFKKPVSRTVLSLAVGTLFLASASAVVLAAASKVQGTLATADQKAVETLAIKLLNEPEFKKQKEETRKQFLADATAKTEAGKKTLNNAVDELAFAAAEVAANDDPSQPKLVWFATAPRSWLGHQTPGGRWGIDNPDNVYRQAPVDGQSKYEITVRVKQPAPAQFSFLIYDSFLGENTKQKNLDTPIAGLRDRDIKINADGTFKITIDNQPANGRINHIQSNADAKTLLVRNTFNDWGKQNPFDVQIKRIDGPASKQDNSPKALAKRAADYLRAGTSTLLSFKSNSAFSPKDNANALTKPFVRGGGWGFAASGSYKLAADEGLLVTLNPLGAKYLGFDLTDPWLVSREHIRANGSLNNNQAKANADGTYTYVVAAKDPGIHNWLDTSGLNEGSILIRWQALPEGLKVADGAVREVKVVKLADLLKQLPASIPKVSPAERQKLYAERAENYAHRYLVN